MDTEKKIHQRSSPYPSISLEEAIECIKSVRKNLGTGLYSRVAIVQALDYKGLSGVAVRKVAALVQFSLLERTGNTYKTSTLADRILFPINESDKKNAIKEAAINPKLYKGLFDRFSGGAIPSMLENILIQQYSISQSVAKSASRDFVLTIEFAGLLKNGIVTNEVSIAQLPEEKTEQDSFPAPSFVTQSKIIKQGEDDIVSESKALGTEFAEKTYKYGKARLVLPSRMTKQEFDKLKLLIESMVEVIEE